jgi:hypothetical protein
MEGESFSPEDLMLGRATTGTPSAKFQTGLQLVRQLQMIQEAKEEFWGKWVQEIFPSLLQQKKGYNY